ncbi:hypothetical protein D3C86_2091780 [compost metagenome]
MLVGQGQADQAAGFTGHEIDRGRSAGLCCQQQVALVLAVLVVDQEHHLALAKVFDDFFDAVEWHAGALGVCDG